MKLSQRLLAGSLILVSVLIAGVVIIAGSRLRNRLRDEMQLDLMREAQAVGVAWSGYRGSPVALGDSMAKALGRRVTLIDSNGIVVGDADLNGATLTLSEDHSTRSEIVDARQAGFGCSLRSSPSAGDQEMYCAVRHPRGFVRVSIATSSFLSIVDDAQRQVLEAGIIALAAAVVLAWIFSRTVSRPIIELREVARAIAGGDLNRRPALSAPGEVGDLAVALHRMAEQLGTRLRAIEQEEALMLAVIDALDEGILAVNPRGDVVRLNASARRLLDVRSATPFPADQLPPDRALREALLGAMAGKETDPTEATIHDKTLAFTARPLPSGGAVLAVMDLTAQRRLETIRRDFVANVSHELKTPLTVIAGFAQTISDPDLSPEQRDRFIATILANTTRMQRIVDDLLDLSRYESRGWTPNITTVDIDAVAREVFATVGATATFKRIGLDVDIAPRARFVAADHTAVRQVLANLVENAVRYTADGTIVVRATPSDEGDTVWIAVQDSGTGIPSDHLPRIFERFYRVDPGRSRDAGGTGLGLAIVRHLVESHGGRVRAESALGKGTTISVSFPAAVPATIA
ncbi:MAG TPA: ATP-binding protein [Gemmatimonadaceae bacterium]|nr:ATP-binding protein [Gemmatimonadaceae bacterium]